MRMRRGCPKEKGLRAVETLPIDTLEAIVILKGAAVAAKRNPLVLRIKLFLETTQYKPARPVLLQCETLRARHMPMRLVLWHEQIPVCPLVPSLLLLTASPRFPHPKRLALCACALAPTLCRRPLLPCKLPHVEVHLHCLREGEAAVTEAHHLFAEKLVRVDPRILRSFEVVATFNKPVARLVHDIAAEGREEVLDPRPL